MRECPQCHFIDPPYWRNRLFDYEVDLCRIEDVFQMDVDLYLELLSQKTGTTITKSPYCYRLTRTGWVYRIWESLMKVRGWNPQKYYDGKGSKASQMRKMNLRAYMGDYPYRKKQSQRIDQLDRQIEAIKKELANDGTDK